MDAKASQGRLQNMSLKLQEDASGGAEDEDPNSNTLAAAAAAAVDDDDDDSSVVVLYTRKAESSSNNNTAAAAAAAVKKEATAAVSLQQQQQEEEDSQLQHKKEEDSDGDDYLDCRVAKVLDDGGLRRGTVTAIVGAAPEESLYSVEYDDNGDWEELPLQEVQLCRAIYRVEGESDDDRDSKNQPSKKFEAQQKSQMPRRVTASPDVLDGSSNLNLNNSNSAADLKPEIMWSKNDGSLQQQQSHYYATGISPTWNKSRHNVSQSETVFSSKNNSKQSHQQSSNRILAAAAAAAAASESDEQLVASLMGQRQRQLLRSALQLRQNDNALLSDSASSSSHCRHQRRHRKKRAIGNQAQHKPPAKRRGASKSKFVDTASSGNESDDDDDDDEEFMASSLSMRKRQKRVTPSPPLPAVSVSAAAASRKPVKKDEWNKSSSMLLAFDSGHDEGAVLSFSHARRPFKEELGSNKPARAPTPEDANKCSKEERDELQDSERDEEALLSPSRFRPWKEKPEPVHASSLPSTANKGIKKAWGKLQDLDSADESSTASPVRQRRLMKGTVRLFKKRPDSGMVVDLLDDSDDDNVEQEAQNPPARNSGRKKYEERNRKAWHDDDDRDIDANDDDALEFDVGAHLRACRRSTDEGKLPPLPPRSKPRSPRQKRKLLQKIDNDADRALQKLLMDEADFHDQLLSHQFSAVRRIAGVPSDFPFHSGSGVLDADTATITEAIRGLNRDENQCATRGILLADEMGLGKTVEAIGGAILRNILAKARGDEARPCVIVAPNDAVLHQWRETLFRNNVPVDYIQFFQKGQNSLNFDRAIFLLMTRHRLKDEVKRVLEITRKGQADLARSALFPHADPELLRRCQATYAEANAKSRKKNPHRRRGESTADCITRLAQLCVTRMKNRKQEPIFSTLLIDEAHFHKNITAYWGIGAALVAVHSSRRIPITGTPYNNTVADLAAMMTYIDPSKDSARRSFWINITRGDTQRDKVVQRLSAWVDKYVVRRMKNVVLKDLPPKRITELVISQYPAELAVYDYYEGVLQSILRQFAQYLNQNTNNPEVRYNLKRLFTILMSLMSSLRAANIHPMIPGGGREFTKQFSPSRCHLLSAEVRPKNCVCCHQSMRTLIPIIDSKDEEDDKVGGEQAPRNFGSRRSRITDIDDHEEGEVFNDDADDYLVGDDGKVEVIPRSLCQATAGVRHYAHEKCIKLLQQTGDSCPRCEHAKRVLKYKLPQKDGNVYCQNIRGGFTGSSKIDEVVQYVETKLPAEDKCLIFSFFKGGLDLLEGILHYDLKIDCARFDGDLDSFTRLGELERFRKDPKCKVLLASVASGGTGLNLVEANHVLFVDRWFNPFTHDQGEDRCHRINQTKTVEVTYFDCASTVDEAMKQINRQKKQNSKILLADCIDIGGRQQQSLSYADLTGLMGNLLSAVRNHRLAWFEQDPTNRATQKIPPMPLDMIDRAIAGKLAMNKTLAMLSDGSESKFRGASGLDDFIVLDSEVDEAEDEWEGEDD